ncbi:class I adenylate-forming enzyme family protein [Streptomyces sp. NL15-2K]|uniref:class I adenylate-forming enzyme family protein n=1 Tax=Streptomyces sp. NL15-2K TaxID=376149 RepID=UPI000F58712F|nr:MULTISPECIES: AMP-binding protein [Actinomycetes]WKX15444.1 AMP-binding protein [Kutzneria buriramensis]
MNIAVILEMAAASAQPPSVACAGRRLDAAELLRLSRHAADRFRDRPAVLYTGANHLAYPVALFGAALAGVPFVPLNYRLGEDQLAALATRHPGAEVLRPDDLDALLQAPPGDAPALTSPDSRDAVAVTLYTSGTTAAPKAALLRHRHLMAYVLATQEFGAADPADAALVALPPYHIAGLMNLLSNLYSGRRVVYEPAFDAGRWLRTVRQERITHAMVVPTMLARITEAVGAGPADAPALRSLAYGGARTPRHVIERALRQFPDTGFAGAYGLTETSSSIAVLGPDDHREAMGSTNDAVRARLGSVGQPLPGVEVEIRDDSGAAVPAGSSGLVFVRGEQISGEYGGAERAADDGWFATRDQGRMDADGYLFIEGRADDTIIRGGENIAPAEIEDVLMRHPDVEEAAVVGVPDAEWGQRIVAVLVGTADPDEIRAYARERLRSSKTPDTVVLRAELPRTTTGKLLRRTLVTELADHAASEGDPTHA